MHTTLVVIKTNVSLYTHHFYNVIVMSESKKLARFLINEVELDVCYSKVGHKWVMTSVQVRLDLSSMSIRRTYRQQFP